MGEEREMPDSFVPVIDLEGRDVAAQLDSACRRVGFFQLTGHGIKRPTIDALFDAVTEFFRQPIATKMKWALNNPEVSRGYHAKASQGVAYSLGMGTPPDLLETFTMGRDDGKFKPM